MMRLFFELGQAQSQRDRYREIGMKSYSIECEGNIAILTSAIRDELGVDDGDVLDHATPEQKQAYKNGYARSNHLFYSIYGWGS